MSKYFRTIGKALRWNQWIKNLIVFAAPVGAGVSLSTVHFRTGLLAFISFCAASSIGYIANDWNDREIDRNHFKKKFRPFASKALNGKHATIMIFLLIILQFALEFNLTFGFIIVVNCYLALTLSYSFFFKSIPVLEMVVVSVGFMLRAMGGAAAFSVPISQWFFIVISFGSLFMISTKRLAEKKSNGETTTRKVLVSYPKPFLESIVTMSMAITIAGYSLWAFEVTHQGVWAKLTIMPFAISVMRYLWNTEIGDAEVPEILILKDGTILACGVLTILGLIMATYS